MLLLAGLVPATTNAWAPSRTGGTSESGEDKDKDKDKKTKMEMERFHLTEAMT